MKVNELRIGNLVRWKSSELDPTKYQNIISVTLEDIKKISERDKDYNPVKITEEWLLKFGFEDKKKYLLRHKYDTCKIYYGSDLVIRLEITGRRIMTMNHLHIKHVHQLQNLYHALTGEELEIKAK